MAVALAGFYFLYYSAIGVTMPFLPAYLHGLGLSATRVGWLLALGPLVALFVPTRWGALADAWGRPERVLRILGVCAALCFLPLLWLRSFIPIALALGAHAVFSTSLVPIADALTLRRVHAHGGSYARIRLFGSLGFALLSAVFGTWGAGHGHAEIAVPAVLMALYAAWTFLVRPPDAPVLAMPILGLRPPPSGLLADRPLTRVLVACALHWIACAPYNATFGLHVASLRLPGGVVGGSASLGVLAEVMVMATHPFWGRHVRPQTALRLAFGLSAARWALTAVVVDPNALVLVSLLHGFTFGAFYVAAVAYVSGRVPDAQRAGGQALFASITFGLGGLLGYGLAGAAYDWLGGARLFAVAAVLELIALAWVSLGPGGRDAPVTTGVIA